MSGYKNSKKDSFLNSIPTISLDAIDNDLSMRCKFNFSYFHVQEGISQSFADWAEHELVKLLEKLKEYSKFSLEHWKKQIVGKYPVLAIYDQFPTNTDFQQPTFIPHQAEWGRFHLENTVRIIGFVIPHSHHDQPHSKTRIRYDRNTFYIVYLDRDHRFYKTDKS